jgi:FtsP/CotA-like multicopper oxidase with cupredoxin domain
MAAEPLAGPAFPATGREFRIMPAPGRALLAGAPHPDTAVWAYNGQVPGPEIPVRQGDRLRVVVENGLAEDTTVHWHGIRVPNAMDGVPHVTQKPIPPRERFAYEFDLPDAGTYWYHPHQRSAEQVGRGLHGPLIVEERTPIEVDRDVTWVLDDWRLRRDAQISADFHDMHDVTHNGRIGNTVTVNGRIPEAFPVTCGERIRLRLINVANARIFGLELAGHAPQVIALDGQPVPPHAPEGGRVVLGPGMRVDLVLDMNGKPGEIYPITDTFYRGFEYRFVDVVYGPDTLRERPPDLPIALAPNALPEPDLKLAECHAIVFAGGMMGSMTDAMMDGTRLGMREIMRNRMAWAINGIVATDHVMPPLLRLARGKSYVLALRNDTAWHHPIHLHGHSFRVIRRNGQPTRFGAWQDTVLIEPRQEVDVAFVADNPGEWMLHCHILEHQAGGMMAVVRVA